MTDNVNHPAHYTFGDVEVIEVIEDWELDYRVGNIIKYVARAGRKSAGTQLEDLKKAHWYAMRAINHGFLTYAPPMRVYTVERLSKSWAFTSESLLGRIVQHIYDLRIDRVVEVLSWCISESEANQNKKESGE